MAKKKFKYEEGMAELERIIADIENDEISVDELSSKVKRANELLKSCNEILVKTEKEVSDILTEKNNNV